MNKYYIPIALALLSSCSSQPIKPTPKPTHDLLIETICESQNGLFRYYRTYTKSNTTPSEEIIDYNDDGTLDYIRLNNMWCELKTNNTPEILREGKIITTANCKEEYDPFGNPMKPYWESSFFSNRTH